MLMNLTKTFLHHMDILSRLKDVEMMRMKTKNPPLDQTEGPREEELEKNLSQLVHQRRRLPSQLASLKKVQPWISTLARNKDPRESFNELMDTPLDFLAFVLNRLKVNTLTPEQLAGPTFELMKGSCKILVELEYFLEEVCKATTDQLDWNNSKGQQYPHDLRKPLPSIPNFLGHRVIPFDHFINNEIAYLSGGVSSRTYATSVTKTKAADYGYIKWIEDLVPNTMWSQVELGIALIILRNRIIGIKKLTIVKWHNYKHLEWITVRRDDDKLYTFKEGDYNRLRLQDIKDMLLLLVQGKLTNLNIEERLALGVSLRMFTRSIVIRRRVEDLQLGHKDKKNRLMRIDELDKFSDDTLKDVRSALDDILKWLGIEHQSDTQVITMKMEILLEPTSNKLMVDPHGFKGYLKMEVKRSALIDIWVPLVDLLSAQNLIGAASTSSSVSAAIVSTTALSTAFASASSVPPITTDDFEIVNVDGQEDS
ncbi:hypothetical protein Tco_0824897 [Tanacetum coccineum]